METKKCYTRGEDVARCTEKVNCRPYDMHTPCSFYWDRPCMSRNQVSPSLKNKIEYILRIERKHFCYSDTNW